MSGELAVHVDEVGIVFGRHREFLLKSSYQLLFRVDGDSLVPFACEALAIAFTRGRVVPAQQLFARVEPARREALEQVCRMLHFRNYGNIGIPGLEFFFNVDPGVPLPDPGHIEWLVRETLPDPSLAVCEITEGAGASRERVGAFAEDLKRIGVRLAVDDFGAGESTLDRVRLIEPDTVKIDAGWFRAAARNPESSALLPDLFAGFRVLGCQELVEGIETSADLAAALAAGADFLQGYYLARPALAGTFFDDTPLGIGVMLDENVQRVAANSR